MTILIDLQKVALQGSDRALLDNLSLTISSGDRIGVVGINGAGKSILLNIIAGNLAPDSGDIRRGRGVQVGFLEQIPTLPSGTVRAALGSGWQVDACLLYTSSRAGPTAPPPGRSAAFCDRCALATGH